MKRVVITGIGVVSPIGNTVEDFWANIKANKHGFGFIDDITSEDFEVKIAARSKDFSCEKYIDKKESRRIDRFTQFAVCASLDAMAELNLITLFEGPKTLKINVLDVTGKVDINSAPILKKLREAEKCQK